MRSMNTPNPNRQIATCALRAEFQSDGSLQMLPWGRFRGLDGRPTDVEHWVFDETNAAAVLARMQSIANPMPIYYEHQDVLAAENGKPAPAAGWVDRSQLMFRGRDYCGQTGCGLFATTVNWTEVAKNHIHNREYLYFSPLIKYLASTGVILNVINGSLVNEPNLDAMRQVAALATKKYFLSPTSGEQSPSEEPVELKLLLGALGLPDGTDESAALAAVKALKADEARVASLRAENERLRTATPDPAEYVSMARYDALRTQQLADRKLLLEGVLEANARKLPLPRDREWAEAFAVEHGVEALKERLKAEPEMPALDGGTQTGGKPPEGAEGVGDDPTQEQADAYLARLKGGKPNV